MTLNRITLTHAPSNTVARILPGFGFNCYQLQVQDRGQTLDLLRSVQGFETGQQRASRSGIPLLFPFPGRLAGTTLDWQGKSYRLEAGDDHGNAIHGFVLNRPWRVIEQSASRATGQFQASVDAPELIERWPADFRITAQYTVGERLLEGVFILENPDSRPLPCGFGTHPHFRLPLGGELAERCIIRLPVSRQWQLQDMLTTGEVIELSDAAQVQAGQEFGELQLDHVYSGLQFDEFGTARASILDPDSGRTLRIAFNDVFRECVVFTPPHREAICIEPYTCAPAAFHLFESRDTGIRVLRPGESFTAKVAVELETAQH